jgi:DNA-binding NarL/FixJ family response regulator
MTSVRVAVLSDDRLLREGLMRIVGDEATFAVVGEGDEAKLPPALDAARPDVLLLDSRMEGALELCARLGSEPEPAVILLAARDDDNGVRDALSTGARGVLTMGAKAEDLVNAVRVVGDGSMWAPRRAMAACIRHLTHAALAAEASGSVPFGRLSKREREVFQQAASGLGNKEIADRLAISEATVKVHLTHIFRKLGLRGRGELAAAYYGIRRVASSAPPPLRPSV